MSIRIVTWNVNSLRSAIRKNFCTWLATAAPDIVCLQEVRAELKQLQPLEELFSGYRTIWHPAIRPGYSGVAILSRFEPLGIERGLNVGSDPEGRALTVDYGAFRVASLYAPNAIPDTPKLQIKKTWLKNLTEHCSQRGDKPFIVCGDLNVAHTAHDSRGIPRPSGINGCTQEERSGFQNLLDGCNLFDPHREQNPNAILSTWWHAIHPARENNYGIRFDYTLLPTTLRPLFNSATIHPEVEGSDHCPVSLTLDLPTQELQSARAIGQTKLL